MTNEPMIGPGYDTPTWPPLPESRYYEPTEMCPHPERWTSTDGDSTEIEVSEFIGALVRIIQPDFVVETGAAYGQTSEQIVRALLANGRGRYVGLEVSRNRAKVARRRIAPAPGGGFKILCKSSLRWTPPADSPPIGLLFLDTTREARMGELEWFAPWLARGAIVAIHDFPWDRGPYRGWIYRDVVDTGLGRVVFFHTPRGLALIEWNEGEPE